MPQTTKTEGSTKSPARSTTGSKGSPKAASRNGTTKSTKSTGTTKSAKGTGTTKAKSNGTTKSAKTSTKTRPNSNGRTATNGTGSSLFSGKMIAAAAGVAAVAAAGVATAKAVFGSDKDRKVYHVKPSGDGWEVKADGADRASGRFDTKEEAVESARGLAHKHEPSKLVIHRADGSVAREHTYGEETTN